MPEHLPTLLEIVRHNGNDAAVGLIDEAATQHPEISGMFNGVSIPNVGAARTISGTMFNTLTRTGVFKGGFRNLNEGAARGKSTYEKRRVECFPFNPRWECDKMAADASEDGPEIYIATEGGGILEGAMQHLCEQFYYGTANSTKGFPGLQHAVTSAMTVDAGGTTANSGMSVYAVRFGVRDVQWIFGADGSLNLSDVRIGDVDDADGNPFTAYIQELMAHIGVAVNSTTSVARLKNITAQAGKTLNDEKMAELANSFKAGQPPHAYFMNKAARLQWKNSRTATNATGADAPFPTEYENVPVIPTEALWTTEAIS